MSAHATATAIEQEAEAFCRRRYRDQADYLEAKDAHCKRIRALIRQLRPQLGTVEMLSLGTGRREAGRLRFDVIARTRTARRA